MATLAPSEAIHRRHLAAMTIVKELDPEDRVLLLAYVVAGSERIRELEDGLAASLERRPGDNGSGVAVDWGES